MGSKIVQSHAFPIRKHSPQTRSSSPLRHRLSDKFVLINIFFLEPCSHPEYIAFMAVVIGYLYLGSV